MTCAKDASSDYKSYEYDGAMILLPTYLTADLTALCQPLTDMDLPTHLRTHRCHPATTLCSRKCSRPTHAWNVAVSPPAVFPPASFYLDLQIQELTLAHYFQLTALAAQKTGK